MDFSRFLPLLELSLAETKAQKSKLRDNVSETNSDIMKRVKALHDAIDEICETLLKWTGNVLKTEIKRLEKHEDDLENIINLIKTQSDIENENQPEESLEDAVVLRNCIGKDNVLSNVHRLTEFQHVSLKFKPGENLNEEFTKSLLGSIENYKITPPSSILKCRRNTFPDIRLTLIAEFKCQGKSGNIHAIAPISSSEAWVCCGWGSKEIELYHLDGKQKVSLKLEINVDHVVLTQKGDILVSSYNGKMIQRINQQLKVSTFASLSFIPRGMAVTDSDEVYVCGVERTGSSNDSTMDDNRRHLIAKFSSDGELLSETIISPNDAHRVTLTRDDRLCFSDYGKNNKRQLVLMDKKGENVRTYGGVSDPDLENPFYPLGIVCDHYGHIIVSDWNNDCVHFLDKNGNFQQLLIEKSDGMENPSALAIDRDGQLWVGNATGKVRVYNYFSW